MTNSDKVLMGVLDIGITAIQLKAERDSLRAELQQKNELLELNRKNVAALLGELIRMRDDREAAIAAALETKMAKIWAELDLVGGQTHGTAEYGYLLGWSEAVSTIRDKLFPYGRASIAQPTDNQ